MFKFKIQRFAYQTTDLVTVGQVKTLANRIALRLTALESAKNIRAVVVDDATKTLKFYSVLASEITQSTVPETIFNYPEEIYLSQTGTEIVENFTFSAAAYPGATDPNLDGKTVLILAVKGDDPTNPTKTYSFVNMSNIFTNYVQKPSGNVPADNVMLFDGDKNAVDSGHSIATDVEFTEMLDEVLPTVSGGNN